MSSTPMRPPSAVPFSRSEDSQSLTRTSSDHGGLRSASSRPANADSYLSELLSYSLDRLKKEPDLLKQDSEQLRRQHAETSVTHYEAFLAADRCLASLDVDFHQLHGTLKGCLETLPSFVEACEEVEKGASIARQKWVESKKLLANRERVSTLLEIPRLMETCVRNGNIDEALDLQSFVHRLGVVHGDLSAVQALTESSMRVRDLILSHLTEKLKSGIQLPECLSVVGHLRRLGVYSERDLRLCFLLCREQWISALLSELDRTQAFDYLKRLTDIHRLHLFDIVMQYKAIFSTETAEGDGGMLSEWALHRVTVFLDALRATLPEIGDGASLLSLLESCMYCGMSLGRVGLDFRYLLIPIFEPRTLQIFKGKLDDAVHLFSSQLETHRWTAPNLRETGNVESNGSLANGTPPPELSRHLPLALFVNGYLSGLNELRHCAPLRGHGQIMQWTREALDDIVRRLQRYEATRTLDAAQRSVFLSACRDAASILCPYIALAVSSIYPESLSSVEIAAVVDPLERIDGYS